eukprot:m51a1_g14522 putative swim zinc finger domain-containing (137) ;mRNA; f:908819-909229
MSVDLTPEVLSRAFKQFGPSPSDLEVGKLGEFVVYQHLLSQGLDAVWHNEEKESGHWCDITVKRHGTPEQPLYVEVKSTSEAHKELFPVSVAQWQKAVELADSFVLYVVFGVGSAKVSVFSVSDLPSRKVPLYVPV